ncbi:VrrA/YqfQ family protein [Lederbergia citrea]|uniref:YqfQ-like protein n=1 Tax=Lederbergia citrea TaxID=2833581 RepID=A0A942UPF8_9BACI|nr:VrrA/YqfQ family protein [Lederbergia citrea]MBS4222458.1 hypothetical protein [Lederbergia citrea]
MMLGNRGPMPGRMGWPGRAVGGGGGLRSFGRGAGFGQSMARNTPGRSGLLSSLFQRQSAPQSAAMFSRGPAQGGSFLQGLTNPQTINGFLNNTQSVLKTAQQFGPMIQQYGPMVRNLPAMWRLYQGLKNSSDDPETPTETEAKETKAVKTKSIETQTEQSETIDKQPIRRTSGESVPKLYIH